MLHAVILAGGSGTRLWPLSRVHYPKQFLQLLGNHTLLQQTVLRLGELIPADRVWVVTGVEQACIVRSQLSALRDFAGDQAHILVEPEPKNTAAAIGLAAVHLRRQDPHAVMLVLPADHWIEHPGIFIALVQDAVRLAQQEALVALGIVPDRAETGYGYLQATAERAQTAEPLSFPGYRVARFVEKPDARTAHHYLDSGAYYWNAGIFVWPVATILEEIATSLPLLAQGLAEIARQLATVDAGDSVAAVYQELEAISIDYGVLEKSTRLVVVPADIGWSDLGDWTAIHRLSARDEQGNTLGPHVIDIESENSFVYSDGRLIATIGLKDTVIVDAEDALLVCARDRVQEVKAVAQQLQARGSAVAYSSRTVHRPWGTYTVMEEGPGFKVKRLVVYPGAALSLQVHHHRNEHWVVVSGTAQVTQGEQVSYLRADQSTYVPAGMTHRLANVEREPLEVVEVQTGSYLGEDDIVRLEDRYQRTIPVKK